MVTERNGEESRRVAIKKTSDGVVRDAGERIEVERIPDVEMVASAAAKHAIGFAIGQVLVSEEHDAELADYRVESAVHERQGSRIRRLEFDPFGGTEFSSRDRQHGRIEITRDQTRGVRKGIPQKARDD